MKNIEEIEYIKTNRQNKLTPKSGLSWCDCCDSIKIGYGKKCPLCKHIQGGRRTLKKETNS